MRTLIVLLLSVVMTSAAEPLPKNKLIYKITVEEIFESAHKLGLRVDELGNGGYDLYDGRFVIGVLLPSGLDFIDPPEHRRSVHSPEEMTLYYCSKRKAVSLAAINAWNGNGDIPEHVGTAVLSDNTATLQTVLTAEYGISPRTVQEHIRSFVAEIHRFEKQIRKTHP